MSYHYITLHPRMHLPTTTNVLPLNGGKFKLANQQDSSIRPISAFVPFKRLNSCWS